MTDVVIKRLSELDRAHTPLLNDMLHIMRGDKDYHILYGDYVDAILPGLGVDEPKWNAGKLHNVPVVITNPNDKEYIVYNSASNSFINKQILYSDINYGTLGVVNGLEYLKVVSGNLTSSRILTTELQPSNVNAAGKYLRISADGMSVYEDALLQETTIETSDITNLNTSQSGIGQITSATLNRPSGSVGFAFVAKQPNGNSAAMITVDTNNGETKVRTHNGGVSFDGSENIDLPGVNTTGNQNTSGNAATATYATSAGSATSAGTATYATSAGTATSATNATVSLENRASISGETSTGSVTNAHLHQVNASSMSTSSYYNSQVNASSSCNATARTSQVNASSSCNATGVMSQANASLRSNASHTLSQVNVSSDSISSGYSSQVNASSYGRATGTNSQVNASEMSTASGKYSQINASTRVENSTDSSTAWGHAESGSRSTANQKIRLDSKTGVGRFKGSTTTGGFDYAEYFPHLNNGVIPDGTIVTLVNEKITPAQAGDFILGTVSATAGVIGNAPEFCWSGRFLKDEFGRELKQEADFVRWQSDSDFYDGLVSECDKPIPSDATYYKQYIPVENPDYVDISGDYKPRGDRKDEWSIIGLMGQVYVRVYEDIAHNTYVGADGKQTEDVTRLYCMKMATPYSTEKGYGVAFCLLR